LAADLVEWRECTAELPAWLSPHIDASMAEGVAWKFAPVHLFPDRYSLALDNDVILWRMPESVRQWLDGAEALLIAEDVRACYGKFAPLCPPLPRNSGIVGVPPSYDLEANLRNILENTGAVLSSETDEQGLQVALVSRERHEVVTMQEVPVCGYFRPHKLELGSCGGHFVGVNAKRLPWTWNARSGEHYVAEYWDWIKLELYQKLE
jgi:hypothetical protein